MKTRFIEVCNHHGGMKINWGKFALCRFEAEEWARLSNVDRDNQPFGHCRLLASQGWGPEHLWVLDLATGEGACFTPGGYPRADLEKHRIWVCPLFEPFLNWLYEQDLADLNKLPSYVEFDQSVAPSALYGHRRPGPTAQGG